MAELDHLSYSSVSTYQLCARSWRYKYVDKVQVPVAPSLVFGSVFHATVEQILRERQIEQPATPESIWTNRWAVAIETEEVDWQGELPEAAYNLGLRMIASKDTAALLATITPMLNQDGEPILEMPVELRVPGVPIPVIGFIDIITADGVPADFKTAARMWTQDKAEAEMQPLFYHAALGQQGYRQNPEMRFRHYVFTKTQSPKAATFETRHSPAQLLWLFGAIREVWRGIDAGVFPPNPGSWLCSEKWCSFYSMCRGRR